MCGVCRDDRFEIIAKVKKHLLEATNIEMQPEELKQVDNILFRLWQLGYFNKEQEVAELKRDKEDLIFVRDQKAKCMCEDKERLTKAIEILKKYHNECPAKYSFEDIDDMAEQFLKEVESTDIREGSTLDGDWVVDEH